MLRMGNIKIVMITPDVEPDWSRVSGFIDRFHNFQILLPLLPILPRSTVISCLSISQVSSYYYCCRINVTLEIINCFISRK